MASPTLKPEKKLADFLKDKQEPFILEVYLLERSSCSKKWSPCSSKSLEKPASSCFFNKNRKPHFPFFKVLLTAIHDKKKKKFATTKDSNITNQHANVAVTITHEDEANDVDQTPIETDRFSTASSSTLFNSCSDIDDDDDDDEDRASFSSHKHYNPLFSSDTCQASDVCNMRIQSQQDTTNGKHQKRCIEVCVTHETLNKDVCVCGVVVPKKFTEESLLSAALFSSLIQTSKKDHNYTKELQEILGHDVSHHVMKSKRVLHKTKRLLFDCVRELTKNLPEKDCKQFMGPEKLGKMLWERTKEWSSQRGGNYERNLSNLLNLDYLDSINEWSEFKTEVKDISIEIADAILECVIRDVVVADMIEILSPTTQQN